MDNGLLCARIKDALDISDKQSKFKSLGFLSEQEAVVAEITAKKYNGRFSFFGGYDGARRVMFVALPDWAEDTLLFDEISSVTFKYKPFYTLSHRDFLGTLMSLGITREKIGDILVGEGRTVVFLCKDILDYVKQQITKVGGVGVTLIVGFEEPLPERSKLVAFSDTVASLRLDNVVSAIAGVSREKSKQLINECLVSRNSAIENKITSSVVKGDVITVRGYGRFVVNNCDNLSKKGRIVLNYSKYV